MNEWFKGVETKTVNPKDVRFTFREWLWAIFALCRFWNKKFHAPYMGLNYRKAMILMRLRGQRPMTMEEATAYLKNQSQETYRLFGGSLMDEPAVHVGNFVFDGLSVTGRVPYLDIVDREIRLTPDFGSTDAGRNIRWPTTKE